MSGARLLVVVYPDVATADGALAALASLAGEGALTLDDAAVVRRSTRDDGGAGPVEVQQAHALAPGEGVVGGGTIGLLLGLAVGGPVVGTLAGMLAGGAGVAAIDTGIEDSQLKRLGGELGPGRAALAALVGDGDWEQIGAVLAPYGGTVLVSEVSDEVADALDRAAP